MQKYSYLPEDTNDFIFSIVCEELGLAGGVLVILLFLSLVLLGLRVARNAADRFGSMLALGIVMWIGFQALINIGVATAALPTKGIALPLVSYGGTGLLLTATALGLLLSVAARSPALADDELAAGAVAQSPA
jgi:cell division protein FtsW